jgi:hypothetical protein
MTSPQQVRSLDGKPVDIVSANGTQLHSGTFRVVDQAGSPTLEVIYHLAPTISVHAAIPAQSIPAILASKKNGVYSLLDTGPASPP